MIPHTLAAMPWRRKRAMTRAACLVAAFSLAAAQSGVSTAGGLHAVHRPSRHLLARRDAAQITITLPGGVHLELVRVPGGTFTMGSPAGERGRFANEGPQRSVTVSTFYLGRTEVTQAQWQAVMGSNPESGLGVGADYPVYYVSRNDVCGGDSGSACTGESFIGRLNSLEGTTKFRLPTEAEWEYAARGGTSTEFPFAVPTAWDTKCGSLPEALPYMWWCGNNSPYAANPVGQKLPTTSLGLLDMHGNLWEWVGDWFGAYPAGAETDPAGPPAGAYRIARGGDWSSYAQHCRSAMRWYNVPTYRSSDFGFRLARSR